MEWRRQERPAKDETPEMVGTSLRPLWMEENCWESQDSAQVVAQSVCYLISETSLCLWIFDVSIKSLMQPSYHVVVLVLVTWQSCLLSTEINHVVFTLLIFKYHILNGLPKFCSRVIHSFLRLCNFHLTNFILPVMLKLYMWWSQLKGRTEVSLYMAFKGRHSVRKRTHTIF